MDQSVRFRDPEGSPPAPPPLPAAVLSLLGDVASAEGDEAEARYWYHLAGADETGRTAPTASARP